MKMKINASSLARVMECPGFLSFEDLLYTTSSFAKEGTAASELLQASLEGRNPGDLSSDGVPFDFEMRYFIDQVVKRIHDTAKGQPVKCEEKVDWMTRSGVLIAGRYDVAFVVGSTLYIDDLKYGYGIVEPKDNWQLIAYAIGKVIALGQAFERITMRIHQPRAHHEDGPVREWTINYTDLLDLKERIEGHCVSIVNGNKQLSTGSHCKYCPAAAEACPAMNKAFHRGIDVVHEFVQDQITDEELAFQLDLIGRVEEVMKIKKSSIEELAIHRIKQGRIVTNYTVEPSLGHRTWKPGTDAKTLELLLNRPVTKQELVSPAFLEKTGVPKTVLDNFTTRPNKGASLKRKKMENLGNEIFGAEAPKGV